MNRYAALAALTCSLWATGPVSAGPDAEVTLKVITWKQYGEALTALRGKVVVVDVWAEF